MPEGSLFILNSKNQSLRAEHAENLVNTNLADFIEEFIIHIGVPEASQLINPKTGDRKTVNSFAGRAKSRFSLK